MEATVLLTFPRRLWNLQELGLQFFGEEVASKVHNPLR